MNKLMELGNIPMKSIFLSQVKWTTWWLLLKNFSFHGMDRHSQRIVCNISCMIMIPSPVTCYQSLPKSFSRMMDSVTGGCNWEETCTVVTSH
jgi:hypothetical protein